MILEAQLDYLIQAVTAARSNGWTRMEPRREVQDAFNARVQEALATTVYNAGGCQSYFLDVNGRNSFNWPWSTDRMRQRLGRFDEAAYDVSREPASATATSR
jgi:cyclohexanone monooxygenase